ncbi:MAG: hypothetical protein ACPGAO_03685 [Flavobacteriaceae bacterium]
MKKGHFEHSEQLDFISCMERLIDYAVDGIRDNSGQKKEELNRLRTDLKSLMRQQKKNNNSSLSQTNEDTWLIDKANYFIQQLYEFVPGDIKYESEKIQNLKKEVKKLKKLTNLLQQEKKQKKMKKSNRLITNSEEEHNMLKEIQHEYNSLKRRNKWNNYAEFLRYLLKKEVGGEAYYSSHPYELEDFEKVNHKIKQKQEDRTSGTKPNHNDLLYNPHSNTYRVKGLSDDFYQNEEEPVKSGHFLTLEYNVTLQQLTSAHQQALKYYDEGFERIRNIVASDNAHDKNEEKAKEALSVKNKLFDEALDKFKRCQETLVLHGLAGNPHNDGTSSEIELHTKAQQRIDYLEANRPKKKEPVSTWSKFWQSIFGPAK